MKRRAHAAAALVLAAAACGGTERAGSPVGDAGGQQKRIRVLARAHLSMAPLLIAEEEGYFREEGLEIERLSLATSRDGLPSLIQGNLDVLTASLSPSYLNAISQGASLRVVADKGSFRQEGCAYVALLARPELVRDGVLLRPAEGRPWRVSVRRGSFYDFLAGRALAAAGIGPQDLELHHLGSEGEAQALAQGRIDVATAAGVPMQRQVEAGTAVLWRSDRELLPDGQFAVLLYGPSLLDQDPEAGARFMTAYLRGVRQYNLGKTERNLTLLERATGIARAELEGACWIGVRDDGRIDLPSVEALQDWATPRGLLDRRVEPREYWQPRFVEEAARRLEARVTDAPARREGPRS